MHVWAQILIHIGFPVSYYYVVPLLLKFERVVTLVFGGPLAFLHLFNVFFYHFLDYFFASGFELVGTFEIVLLFRLFQIKFDSIGAFNAFYIP